jgi:hypothetical protein
MDATKFELAVKTETTPGTAIALSAADVAVRLLGDTSFNFDPDILDPDEVQSTQSPQPVAVGRVLGTIAARYRLRGPGSVSTEPAVSDLWKMAALAPNAAKTVAIGSITSGPFLCSETITGAGGATGLVIRQTATGASAVPYIPLSGTIASSEVITGGTSAATATTAGAPAAAGWCYRPNDDDVLTGSHAATCKFLNDGAAWQIRGALSDISFLFRACSYAEVTQNITGPVAAPTATALFSPTYPEETGASRGAPKMDNDAGLTLGSYEPIDVEELTLNFPSQISPRMDINGGFGNCVRTMNYRRETPTLAIAPALVLPATYDYFSKLTAETLSYCEFTHGSGTGKTWRVCMPQTQITELGWASKDPALTTAPIVMRCCEGNTGNDEVLIWVT